MARGVPQEDVFQAADALLAAGERPTVERVRQALSRGSPNTIGPMLDAWWAMLAQRLRQRLTLPGVPDAVGEAFAHVWEVALAAGQTHAEAAIAPERAALADVVAKVDGQVAVEREAASLADAARQQEAAARHAAEAALAISAQRAQDLAAQVASLQAQLTDLVGRRDALEARLESALGLADAERAAAAKERDALQAHLRQAEDRAYGEIDRTRQELKAEKTRATTQAREYGIALRESDQARRSAESALAKAQRDLSMLQQRLTRSSKASGKSAPPTPAPARRRKA